MVMQANEIEALIKEALPEATVTITDLAGDGNHYAAEVIDESFRGKNRVQQQRIVYSCLLYTSPSPRDQRGSRMPSSA